MSHSLYEDALILVCDSAKALLFKNLGGRYLDLHCQAILDSKDLSESLIYQDRPGRVHESYGDQRANLGKDNRKDLVLSQFIDRIAEHLSNELDVTDLDNIIIVAPPRMLGQIRNDFPDRLWSRIKLEIASDIVSLPTAEIEKHLIAHAQAQIELPS